MSARKLNLSPEVQERLAYLATLVAIAAPMKQGQCYAAYIPWETIHQIRAALDETGWPWKVAQARRVELEKAAHVARMAELYPSEA